MNDCCKVATVRVRCASGPCCLDCAKAEPRVKGGAVYKAPERKEEAAPAEVKQRGYAGRYDYSARREAQQGIPKPRRDQSPRAIAIKQDPGARALLPDEQLKLRRLGSQRAIARAIGVDEGVILNAMKQREGRSAQRMTTGELAKLFRLTRATVKPHEKKGHR